MFSRKSRKASLAKQSRKASLFQARQSYQARQSRQTRRASPIQAIQETIPYKQPIERVPPYTYNKMLQYSGIDYPVTFEVQIIWSYLTIDV